MLVFLTQDSIKLSTKGLESCHMRLELLDAFFDK